VGRATLRLFEIALVPVRRDHVTCVIVNANHGIVHSSVEFSRNTTPSRLSPLDLNFVTAGWCLSCEFLLLMTIKFLALMSVIGLATVCVVQAQSPIPGESPTVSSESPTVSPSPAEKAASPSPAKSPSVSPKAKPTPKKAKAARKARPVPRPVPAARVTEEAANPPAPGGGHGQVWVNTETGVYHREGSRFYGTTRKGKYMIEQDAKQAGYKPAPTGL